MNAIRPKGRDKSWLRKAKQWEHCEGCNKPNDGTIVACHLRHNDHLGYAGTGYKPADWFTVFCCGVCHAVLDGAHTEARAHLVMTLLRKLARDRYRHQGEIK